MSFTDYLKSQDEQDCIEKIAQIEETWGEYPALLEKVAETHDDIVEAVEAGEVNPMSESDIIDAAFDIVNAELEGELEEVEKLASALAEDISTVLVEQGFDDEVIEKIASDASDEDLQEFDAHVNAIAEELVEAYLAEQE